MFQVIVNREIRRLRRKYTSSSASRKRKMSSGSKDHDCKSSKCKHRHYKKKDTRDWRWWFEDSESDGESSSAQTESEVEVDVPDNGIENSVWGRLMSSPKGLFFALLAIRLVNALLLHTSFVPDEYWQSLEVAHKMAFGYGYETWEWKNGLRGYTYPGVFALVFKILEVLHLDYRMLLIKIPCLLHAVLAALGDYYLYKFSSRLAGYKVAQWTLLCQLTSWFTFYCGPRTLTNSAETVITTIGFYYYPWTTRTREAPWKFISLVALAFIIRPTAAIIWAPLCCCHLYLHRHHLIGALKSYILVGLIAFGLSASIDRLFYGEWTIVQYNFMKFNVGHKISSNYGTHPFMWYMTMGLPMLLGPHFIPFCASVKRFTEPRLLPVIIFTVLVYSYLPHKEFRFLFPLLPIAMHYCGSYLYYLHKQDIKERLVKASKKHDDPTYNINTTTMAHYSLITLAVVSVPLMLYTGLLHQRGTIDVMRHLSDEVSRTPDMSALFLMPCHSTPYYSHIHQNISMRFLTCEPNLNKSNTEYIDEADRFYNTPNKWLKKMYPKGKGKPTHVVLFEELEERINNFFEAYKYQTCANIFHSHAPEGRVSGRILVKCLNKKPNVKVQHFV